MSGAQLVAALARVGYPGVEQLDGPALDWMFELPSVSPLLEWLCEEIGPSNVLSEAERNRFDELEKNGVVILEGDQLETALQNASSVQPGLSQEVLRQEIDNLEEEVRLMDERKNILVHHRNKLSLHQAALAEKTARLSSVEKIAQSEYRAALEQSHEDNAKMNDCLSGLTKAVCDITALYTSPPSRPGESANERAVFLSQCDLDSYHSVEEKFTQELTAYTKRLFFEGIAEMSGQNETTRYDVLDISNPESLLVTTEKENVRLDECKELARLHAFFPKSERERLNASLVERAMLTSCEFMERKLTAFKEIPYPKEIKHLREKVQETESVLAVLKRDEAQMTEQELPQLIKDCAATQVTKILSGDYNLKISRQDYFISNQEKVIGELVVQRARNEFLTMAYEVEERCHRDIHKLLTATNLLLQRIQRDWNNRMALMKDPSLQASRHQRSTVDSRDSYLITVNQMLGPASGHRGQGSQEEKQHLFLTYDAVKSRATALKQQVSSLRDSLSAANGSQDDRLAELERNVDACEELVYCGSSTSEGQPSLSPQPIGDAVTQLDTLLKNLEQVVVDVMKDVDTKKKTIKSDPLQSLERELMVCFHTDQKRLRRIIDDLASRVQAKMVT